MTKETLGSITLDIVESNHKIGKLVVDSYRRGGIGLANRLESNWKILVDKGAGRFDKTVQTKLLGSGHKVGSFLSDKVEMVLNGADQALGTVYRGATKALTTVESAVDGLDNAYATRLLTNAGKAALPGAKLALALSNRVAGGANKLHGRLAAGSKTPRKARVKRPSTRTKKSAA